MDGREGKKEEQRRESEQSGHGGRPKKAGQKRGRRGWEKGKGREECDPRKGQKESRDLRLKAVRVHLCAKNVLASLTKGHTSLSVTTSDGKHREAEERSNSKASQKSIQAHRFSGWIQFQRKTARNEGTETG